MTGHMRSQLNTKAHFSSAFTLLEIIVALAVVGIIISVVVTRMDTMLEWDMKKASNRLASTIRYLYDKAALEGLYIRLVFDIEENTYWVEATTDQFSMSSADADSKKKKTDKKTDKDKNSTGENVEEENMATEKDSNIEKDQKADTKNDLFETDVPKLKPHEPVFNQAEDFLLKPTKLPETVFLKDVYVEHEQGPIAGGKVMIHFFPNGYVEHAVVNLRDENDDMNYSLETNSVNGRVTIEDKYRTMGGREP